MARGLPTQASAVPAAAVLAMEAVVHAAPVWRRIPASAPEGGGGTGVHETGCYSATSFGFSDPVTDNRGDEEERGATSSQVQGSRPLYLLI